MPPFVMLQSQFIIVACDGIWDVMEDQEAVDLVREHVTAAAAAGGRPVSGAASGSAVAGGGAGAAPADAGDADARVKSSAQRLVDVALQRGTSDNVTALVVFL